MGYVGLIRTDNIRPPIIFLKDGISSNSYLAGHTALHQHVVLSPSPILTLQHSDFINIAQSSQFNGLQGRKDTEVTFVWGKQREGLDEQIHNSNL